jgi:hypothetical protein
LHDVLGGWIESATEVVEVFKVGFVDGVSDDFNVEVVKVSSRETVAEVGRYLRYDGKHTIE